SPTYISERATPETGTLMGSTDPANSLPGNDPDRTTAPIHQPLRLGTIASVLSGASWQRCRTHFMRNLLTRVPKTAQPFVAALVRSIFAQPDAPSVLAQLERVVAQLKEMFGDAARLLQDVSGELLAFTCFPKEHWRQ